MMLWILIGLGTSWLFFAVFNYSSYITAFQWGPFALIAQEKENSAKLFARIYAFLGPLAFPGIVMLWFLHHNDKGHWPWPLRLRLPTSQEYLEMKREKYPNEPYMWR